jgi:hypothetical protein
MTLFILHRLCDVVVERSVNDALERPPKGTFVADCKQHLLAATEEDHEQLENIRYPIPDSNTGSSECETRLLTT